VEKIKEVAFEAARRAGDILRQGLGNIKNIDYKGAFNLVTDVDKASEREIIKTIKEAFPDDQILAEETGAHKAGSKRRWLIDPLDGTTNFAHSYPCFAVSIGVEDEGKMIFGAVLNPLLNELFWANAGGGAYLGDKQIKVSSVSAAAQGLFATGFPPDSLNASINNMTQFTTVTHLSHGVRRDGSAALDLSNVACGRFEGYWELKLGPWDLAAGTLIVREAGGKVTNLTGGPFDINTGHVVATNGLVHDELIEALSFKDTLLAAR
jgi:myo-inositol-1(or 4)-monophosphatase